MLINSKATDGHNQYLAHRHHEASAPTHFLVGLTSSFERLISISLRQWLMHLLMYAFFWDLKLLMIACF